jgi:hypothetical protein
MALFACVRLVQAQLPALAEVNAQYVPESSVPNADGLRAQVASYDAAVNVPIALSETTYLIPGAQYHVDSVSYSDAPAGFTELKALHALEFPVLLAHQVAERWTLAFRIWPGVAGDSSRLDSGALRLGGLAMASWAPSRQFTLGAGAMASYAFGELLPLPLVYVEWKASPWFRVEGSLPSFVSARFAVGDRLEFGVQADLSGNEYAVRHAEIAESYPCTSGGRDDPSTPTNEGLADPELCLDHVAYSVIAAGGVARLRVVSSLWLTAFLGHTLFRRYDLKAADGDSVPGGSVDLPNEVLFRAGFVFRIPGTD